MKHIKAKHDAGELCPVDEGRQRSCSLCDLFSCAVCGGAEGSLATDCPGTPLDTETLEAIYAGVVDFKNGIWFKKTQVRNLHHLRPGQTPAPEDVYVGRARPQYGLDGYFGSRFKAGQMCSRCDEVHEKPGDTLSCFTADFYERVSSPKPENIEYRRRVLALHGKTLWCWCAPRRCHASVIARWTDEMWIDAQQLIVVPEAVV